MIGGDSSSSLTEGSQSTGSLTISDVDANEAGFNTTPVTDPSYGSFSIAANGDWTYDLNTNHASVQALIAGETLNDTITVESLDGTTHNIVVTINGQDDLAVIGGSSTASLNEDTSAQETGSLTISDVDAGQAAFNTTPVTDPSYGSFSINAAGDWTYDLNTNHASVQALIAGETLNDTITVESIDGTTQNIVITINGQGDAANITSATPYQEYSGSDNASAKDQASASNPLGDNSFSRTHTDPLADLFNEQSPSDLNDPRQTEHLIGALVNSVPDTTEGIYNLQQLTDRLENSLDISDIDNTDKDFGHLSWINSQHMDGFKDPQTLASSGLQEINSNLPFYISMNLEEALLEDDTFDYDIDITQADGDPLPEWLSFDHETTQLVGMANQEDVGDYEFFIKFKIGDDAIFEDKLKLHVAANETDTTPAENNDNKPVTAFSLKQLKEQVLTGEQVEHEPLKEAKITQHAELKQSIINDFLS